MTSALLPAKVRGVDVKDFIKATRKDLPERERVAKKAGTTTDHLFQLAGGHRKASHDLARRLESGSADCPYGQMTKERIRPDIWPETEPETASA